MISLPTEMIAIVERERFGDDAHNEHLSKCLCEGQVLQILQVFELSATLLTGRKEEKSESCGCKYSPYVEKHWAYKAYRP